jgi:hypothetical protein
MALWPTHPPTQWVPGALSLGVKRPGREADHSRPSSAEVKNTWSYTSTPQYFIMAWCLVKHRDNKSIVTKLVALQKLQSQKLFHCTSLNMQNIEKYWNESRTSVLWRVQVFCTMMLFWDN